MAFAAAVLGAMSSGAGFMARGAVKAGQASGATDASVKALEYAKEQSSTLKKQGKQAAKVSGVSFSIAGMLKQSQIFTGVVGSIFQLVGAFFDILLIPLMPVITPILELSGKVLSKFAKYSEKNPEVMAMVIFRMIPILGLVIAALQVGIWVKNWLTGPSQPIQKLKNGVLSFFERLPIMWKLIWAKLKLYFIDRVVQVLEGFDSIWKLIFDQLANMTIPWPDMLGGPFKPFGAVAGLGNPLEGMLNDFTEKSNVLNEEIKDLNKQLKGVIGPDGVKIYGEHLYERLDIAAREKNLYQGYNATMHGTQEQFRMLMGGEEFG